VSKVEGSRPKTGGRVKGTPNKTTALLKDAILKAADAVGEDMQGKGKLVGYCKYLARTEPKAFAGLLGRVLPLQVTGDGGGALVVEIKRFAD
jgi:hypothetical protein